MKLIVNVSDEELEMYKLLANVGMGNSAIKKILGGTPLPKGHGRLIDADRTLGEAWTNFYKHEDEWEKKDNDYVPIGRIYDQNGFECCQQTIVNAPTIIEADEEGEE